MLLFHYGKHKQIDGNHNQTTSMLPINVLLFLVRSMIVGYWKHFLYLRADKKPSFYLIKRFGLTNSTFKYKNPKKKIVWRSTLETLTNLELENLRRLPKTEKNIRASLTETRTTLTLHLFWHGARKLNQYDFLLLNRFLTLILSIKASISAQEVQCLMESLRDNFNTIVQKALTIEDWRIKDEPTVTDYMTILQSQAMYATQRNTQKRSSKKQKKTRFFSTAEY